MVSGTRDKKGILARKQKKKSKNTRNKTKIAQAHHQLLARVWSIQAARGGEGCEIEPGEVNI